MTSIEIRNSKSRRSIHFIFNVLLSPLKCTFPQEPCYNTRFNSISDTLAFGFSDALWSNTISSLELNVNCEFITSHPFVEFYNINGAGCKVNAFMRDCKLCGSVWVWVCVYMSSFLAFCMHHHRHWWFYVFECDSEKVFCVSHLCKPHAKLATV